VALVNLYGVASAKRDVRMSSPGEIRELALLANAAALARMVGTNL
jgi:hypothetical protein